MSRKNKKNTISMLSAEAGDCIYAENKAEVSEPPQGDTNSFDAGSEENRAAEFEELIGGKYKNEFSEKVRKILSRRLKEVKELKENADKNAQIAQLVMKKFNLEDADVETLERMMDEAMSQTTGKNSINYAELLKRLIRENSLLKQDREARLRDMRAKTASEKVKVQAEETAKAYPDFDLRKELKNPEFCRLLKAGVSIKNAYEVVNIDGILDSKSKETERQVLDSIRYKGNRPVENGSETNGGILLSSNISKLNKKQRAELAKRAAAGEKIEF